jgi:hypothetical protein
MSISERRGWVSSFEDHSNNLKPTPLKALPNPSTNSTRGLKRASQIAQIDDSPGDLRKKIRLPRT